MFQPVPAFLALRYATADKQNSFVSFINLFSVAGIALGLMSLIIVLSVMNGFEGQLKQRILGIVPQIVVHTAPDTFDETQFPGVRSKMAFAETEGVLQARTGLRGMRIQGVVPASMEHSIVADNLVTGDLASLAPGSFNVIIGRALAIQLDIRVGDRLRLMVAGASIYTPLGRIPSQRLVTVSGFYAVGSQMDDKVIFMALDDLKRLMRQAPGSPSDTRLFLSDAFNYQQVISQLDAEGFSSDNWRERQGPLFDAVKMEKNMMFMMLLLVIAVAAFNIVSALVMVVTEKQGDIAILQTQGMAPGYVMLVFVLNGIFNGIKGALAGLILGVGITLQLNNILDLLQINLALSVDGHGIPIDLRWHQVVTVTAFSLVLCLVASIYPAYRAMRVQPASALQND